MFSACLCNQFGLHCQNCLSKQLEFFFPIKLISSNHQNKMIILEQRTADFDHWKSKNQLNVLLPIVKNFWALAEVTEGYAWYFISFSPRVTFELQVVLILSSALKQRHIQIASLIWAKTERSSNRVVHQKQSIFRSKLKVAQFSRHFRADCLNK